MSEEKPELQKRLDLQKQARALDQPVKPLPAPDAFASLSISYKLDLVFAWLATQGVTVAKLEELLQQQKAERSRLETRERIAAEKARTESDRLNREAHKVTFDKHHQFLRIEQPRGWDHQYWFKINPEAATLEGHDDCGFKWSIDIVGSVDELLSSTRYGYWWPLSHPHKYFDSHGRETGGGMKIGNSVGLWLDKNAMASFAANPKGPIKWSDRPPEQFIRERPLL